MTEIDEEAEMLSKKVITTLGNSDYRLKSFEKISHWLISQNGKELDIKSKNQQNLNHSTTFHCKNEVQEGLIVKNIDESLTEIARLAMIIMIMD